MDGSNAEKKMALAKMLRNENETNRYKMKTREQVLYERIPEPEPLPKTSFISLKLRTAAAFLLLIGFITWDNGYQGKVYELIADNSFTGNLFAFMEDIPYTLESK